MKGYRIAIRRTVTTKAYSGAFGDVPAGEECVIPQLLAPSDPDPSPYVQDHVCTGVVQIVPLPGAHESILDVQRAFMIWSTDFFDRIPKHDPDRDATVRDWGVGETSAARIRSVLRAEREAASAQVDRNHRRRKLRPESTHDRNKRWRSEARPCTNKSEAARVIAEREGVEFETVRKALTEKSPARRSVLKR